MKRAVAVFAIIFLTVSSVMAQVHIKESATIAPGQTKKTESVTHTLRFVFSYRGTHVARLLIWWSPCNVITSSDTSNYPADSIYIDLSPGPAGSYAFDPQVGAAGIGANDSVYATFSIYEDNVLVWQQSETFAGSGALYSDFGEVDYTTSYFNSFNLSLGTHQFMWGNSTGMNLSGAWSGDCGTTWSPHTDPVTLTIVSGSQYVSFHMTDPLTGADTKLGSTATTIGDNIGEYSLVADGVIPDSSGDWATIQAQSNGITGTDSIQILPGFDHFYVYAVPDTINDSGTTALYVQAMDVYNHDINYSGTVQISASPPAFGNLVYNPPPLVGSTEKGGKDGKQVTMNVSSNDGWSSSILRNVKAMKKKSGVAADSGVVVDYSAANLGQVIYSANGTVPDSNTTITFTVTAISDVTKTGMGTVVILGSQAQLEVVPPKADQNITGDNPPKMPKSKIKAQLHYKKNIPVDYSWEIKIKWNGNGGWTTPRNDEMYSGDTTGQTNKWTDLNINLNAYVRGGQTVTLKVDATTAENSATKSPDTTFAVKGKNPDTTTVLAALGDLKYKVIAYQESEFHQFVSGYPRQGDDPNDFGIMQIDSPKTDDIIWDWTKNIQRGKDILDYNFSVTEKFAEDEYPACTDSLTYDQRLEFAYSLYNQWKYITYWQWEQIGPPEEKQYTWVKHPPAAHKHHTKSYAEECWDLYTNPPSYWH